MHPCIFYFQLNQMQIASHTWDRNMIHSFKIPWKKCLFSFVWSYLLHFIVSNFNYFFLLFGNPLFLFVTQKKIHSQPKIHHSRNHSMSQADYDRTPKSPLQHHHSSSQNGNIPFKPVPPPKPKNYRPMVPSNGNASNGNTGNQWEATVCITFWKVKYEI